MAAVAAQTEGFTTLGELVPALAFHGVISAAGLQLLSVAARRGQEAAKAPGADSPVSA